MSLETTLAQTNTLLTQLLAMLQTGIQASATLGEPEVKATRGRPRKSAEEVKAEASVEVAAEAVKETAAAVTKTESAPLGLVDGDPVGTRYFVIEKHNTVYAQKPGDPDCTIQGAKIVSAEHFLAKKEEFAKKFEEAKKASSAPAPAATTAPAADPAPSTPAAPTASSQPSVQTPAHDDVPFSKIVEAATALLKSDKPGHGRPAVTAILTKWLPGVEQPTITKMQPLGKNAEILADFTAAMAEPKAEAAGEDFDLLG